MQQKQSRFVQLIGKLIAFAYSQGYEFTFGDAARIDKEGHKKDSFHYIRLAVDLNLFINGRWQKIDCPQWQTLGNYWKNLDNECTWGGDFKEVDLNHFSYGER